MGNRRIHRVFACEMSEHSGREFVANSRDSVRIMAVVVGLEPTKDEVHYPGTHVKEYTSAQANLMLLSLDDGSGVIDIVTPSSLIQDISPPLEGGQTLDCIAMLRQRGTLKKWYADSLDRVTDPHAEILRWMEISQPPKPHESFQYGYPTIQASATEALRLIAVQTSMNPDGVTLEDLALVLQISTLSMERMIIELQLSGQIYQNAKGNYVSL